MGQMAAKKDIWVVMETEKGQCQEVGYEMIHFAQVLAFAYGYHLVAVVIGYGVEEIAWEAVRYGADSAILVDHDTYEAYKEEVYLETIAQLFQRYQPAMIFIGGTERGLKLALDLGVQIDGMVFQDCGALRCLDLSRGKRGKREACGDAGALQIQCIIGLVIPGEFEKCPYNPAMMGNIVDGYEQLQGAI